MGPDDGNRLNNKRIRAQPKADPMHMRCGNPGRMCWNFRSQSGDVKKATKPTRNGRDRAAAFCNVTTRCWLWYHCARLRYQCSQCVWQSVGATVCPRYAINNSIRGGMSSVLGFRINCFFLPTWRADRAVRHPSIDTFLSLRVITLPWRICSALRYRCCSPATLAPLILSLHGIAWPGADCCIPGCNPRRYSTLCVTLFFSLLLSTPSQKGRIAGARISSHLVLMLLLWLVDADFHRIMFTVAIVAAAATPVGAPRPSA